MTLANVARTITDWEFAIGFPLLFGLIAWDIRKLRKHRNGRND